MLASEVKELQEKSQKTLSTIRDCLEDNKAFDIIEIDLKGKTEEADFMLIATGSSKTQISAISQKVMIKLKKEKVLSAIEISVDAFKNKNSPYKISDYQNLNVSDQISKIIFSYIEYVNRNTWKK